MPQPTANSVKSLEDFVKQSPVLGTLLLLSFMNWFVCFGINIYLHGDAVGTFPSRDGFVVKSHGLYSPVSESVWLFGLFYSAATKLITPAIWIAAAVRIFRGRLAQPRWLTGPALCAFVGVWCFFWYSSVGRSFHRSLEDWQTLKRPNHGIQRTGASRSARAVLVARWRLAPAADAERSPHPQPA
jgi:hypothetical protein